MSNTAISNTNRTERRNEQARHLWQAITHGKPEALEELFKSHYAALFDYGIRLCGQEELVKDSIQEIFAYIWEKRAKLSLPHSVKAYLLVSLRRVVLKTIETRARHEVAHKEFGNLENQQAFSSENLMIYAEMARAEQRRLKQAFERIPVRMREALYMKTYDGLTYREIAQIMGISPQVARNYVSEAFKRLRVLITDS